MSEQWLEKNNKDESDEASSEDTITTKIKSLNKD